MLGTMELYGRNASVVYGFKKLQGQSVYSWSLRLFSLVDVIKINQSINLCHVKDEQVSSLAKSKRILDGTRDSRAANKYPSSNQTITTFYKNY